MENSQTILIVFLFCSMVFLSLVSAAECNTGADQEPCDGIVNMTELMDHINGWYRCSACVPDLFQAIEAYYMINPFCGNDIIETGEVCDGTNLSGNNCTTIGKGFTGGILDCLGDCSGYNTSECTFPVQELTECQSISNPNSFYVMNQDIFQELDEICIRVTAENVTIDCQGNSITSSSTAYISGIHSTKSNTVIKNCNIFGFSGGWGIYLNGANDSYIFNNTLNDNYQGCGAENSSNIQIINNTMDSNGAYGIYLGASSNNTVQGNNITNNSVHGISIYPASKYNLIKNNKLRENPYAIFIDGHYNEILDNEVYRNKYGIYSRSLGNIIKGNNIANIISYDFDTGIQIFDTSNNIVENNSVVSTPYAINLILATDTSVISNSLDSNYYGISLHRSSDNTIENNTVKKSQSDGLYVSDIGNANNLIRGNDFCSNYVNCLIPQIFINNTCYITGSVCGGVCDPCIPIEEQCVDPFGGVDYEVQDYVIWLGQENWDYCDSSDYLHEYACQYNNFTGIWDIVIDGEVCQNNCSYGACNMAGQTCMDSDGGLDYGVHGVCSDNRLYPGGVIDSCSGSVLTEYYCRSPGPACYPTSHNCSGGCENGTCIGAQSTDVFVTTGSIYMGGLLGGLAGADSKCQERADFAGLAGTWIALLSNGTTDVRDRIPEAIYRRMDGAVIAMNKSDLFDGTINTPIDLTELGDKVHVSYPYVWTGSNADGTAATHCDSWSNTGSLGTTGHTGQVNDRWIKNAVNTGCDRNRHLYCIRNETY